MESEVAVELGDDGRSIVALLPALEIADPPDLDQDVETILAGNIFHRAVAFGPRVETDAPGAAASSSTARSSTRWRRATPAGHLEDMVEAVGRRLSAVDEELRAGVRIITGILAPPHAAHPGDRCGSSSTRWAASSCASLDLDFRP